MRAFEKHEQDVANYINGSIPGLTADRPKSSTSYSDVFVTYARTATKATKKQPAKKAITVKTWVEVKMNHTDNLMNPRFSFVNNAWKVGESYESSATSLLQDYWNQNTDAREWIESMREWLKTKKSYKGDPNNFTLYSTLRDRKNDSNSVDLSLMKQFLATRPNKNICTIPNVDIGNLVTLHYLKGKAAPAPYLSAGDDFYRFGNVNPFKIPNVPVFKGSNNITFRVGDRSGNYELQAEVKVKGKTMSASQYSVVPNTKKKNPFKFMGI